MRRAWPFLVAVPLLVMAAALAIIARPTVPGFAQYAPEAALERGRLLYTGSCASCHGQNGEGGGVPGLGLPRLDAGGTAWQLSDIDLTRIIRNGRGAMPGIGNSWTKEGLGAVLTLLRSWWSPEQRTAHDADPQTRAP